MMGRDDMCELHHGELAHLGSTAPDPGHNKPAPDTTLNTHVDQ